MTETATLHCDRCGRDGHTYGMHCDDCGRLGGLGAVRQVRDAAELTATL